MTADNAGFILHVIALVFSTLLCLITSMILTVIIYHFYCKRIKQEDKVTIILCINIYLMILVVTVIIVSFNIQTLLGDLYEQDFNSSWCIFIGYIWGVFLTALYWSFINQVIIN
jgi:hypothetical protein